MADEADWLSEDTAAESEPAPVAAEGAPAPAAEGGEPMDAGEAMDELDELEDEPVRKRQDRGDRPLIFKYWKRPVHLQYAYLYDYRHNYYDDVIDYLDRRQRGLDREIPRAQTWAERALRTYASKNKHSEDYHRREKDITLLSDIRTSNRFYKYHYSKEYFTTKYSSIM